VSLGVESLEERAVPAALTASTVPEPHVLVVKTAADGLGPGTLRSAIRQAQMDANGFFGFSDTIKFDTASMGTNKVTLTQGELQLSQDSSTTLTIDGENNVTIDAGGNSRVFEVAAGTNAVLSGLTISGGNVGADQDGGGGILNRGDLTVNNSTLKSNVAFNSGGGILSYGTVVMNNSTVMSNLAQSGAGIRNFGPLGVSDSTFANNLAVHSGGAIENSGTLTIHNSTVSGNAALVDGGGIGNQDDSASGAGHHTGVLVSTIVAGNHAKIGPDVSNFAAGQFNLIGDGSGMVGMNNGPADHNQIGVGAPLDPKLGQLGDNGGPTKTFAVLPGSLALGAGSNPDALSTDQRGDARTGNGKVDIGAFQTQAVSARAVAGPQALDQVFATDFGV
jgi:predicted outer membrane repeat protein